MTATDPQDHQWHIMNHDGVSHGPYLKSTTRIVLTGIGELAIDLQLESADEGRTRVVGILEHI